MSNGFGSFGNGPSDYVDYKVHKESHKGGGKGPSSNSGCLSSIISMLGAVIILVVIFAY